MWLDAGDGAFVVAGVFLQEPRHERGDVLAVVFERGRADVDHIETVEEILAERAGLDELGEVLVRRGHEAEIDGNRLAAPQAHDRARLNRPQEFHLRVRVNLADLVEEESPAVRGLEAPGLAVLQGPREGAGRVAEEFRDE